MTSCYPKPDPVADGFAKERRERRRKATPRQLRAQEIEAEITALIPELKRVVGGRDFRPNGHAEEIVSGLMIPANDCWNPDVQIEPEDRPFLFSVMFGGESLFNIAICRLRQTGIEAEAQLPGINVMEDEDGKDIRIKRCTWRLSFTLPYDWSAPK